MKKYTKPAVEIEKFTVADIITLSAPDENQPNVDTDIGELSAGLEVGDEF